MEELKTGNDSAMSNMIEKYWRIRNDQFFKELDPTDLDIIDCCMDLYSHGMYRIDYYRGIDFGQFEEELAPLMVTNVYQNQFLKGNTKQKKYVDIFEKEYQRLIRELQSLRTLSSSLCALRKSI